MTPVQIAASCARSLHNAVAHPDEFTPMDRLRLLDDALRRLTKAGFNPPPEYVKCMAYCDAIVAFVLAA